MKDATLLILQNIQARLGDLQTGLDRVQTDLAVFREEVDERFDRMHDELHGEIGSLRNELHGEIGSLRTDLRAEIHELREEVRVGFKATMKQNDRRFLDHEARIRALERRR